jgi:glycosyltransferase involved in cell wall biosynthesis
VPTPLSILHALDKNRLTTGSVVQMFEAASGLIRRGHQVIVTTRPGGDLEAACTRAGITFLALPLRHAFDLGSARQLRYTLRRESIDVVHAHKGRPHSLALLAAAGLGARPRVVVNRGVSFPLDLFNRWKYRHPRVAAVVCVAEAVRQVVLSSGGLRPERVHTIHGGTDPGVFDPDRVEAAPVRAELGLTPEQKLVTQISVRDWKGWHDLVTAFARVAPRQPRARLLLVGCEGASDTDKVRAVAREHGIDEVLLTVPYRSDMPAVLAASDVVVDASRSGTGITGTIREAMALGRAVVASDCGGNRELVSGREVGLLIPASDPAALATALLQLLGDADLRARMGRAGRQRVVERFSTDHRIDRLERLYRQVLEEAC